MITPKFLSYQKYFESSELLCAFSTRNGGISEDPYASLNLGLRTGDSKQHVLSNRDRFFSSINVKNSQIAFTDQIHSASVKIVSQPGIYQKTDALITDQPNLYLAIQTADCFPVFLFLPGKNIVAAIHAGWRGALNGIVDNTISLMKTQFKVESSQISAFIGPGLQSECFELEQDVYDLFDDRYLLKSDKENKKLLNLEKFIWDRLLNHGIQQSNIKSSAMCTKCLKDEFYSYRRDGNKSGRMMGIIGCQSK